MIALGACVVGLVVAVFILAWALGRHDKILAQTVETDRLQNETISLLLQATGVTAPGYTTIPCRGCAGSGEIQDWSDGKLEVCHYCGGGGAEQIRVPGRLPEADE